MELILTKPNNKELGDLLDEALKHTSEVYAAVAYASDVDSFFIKCFESNIPVKLWGRYRDNENETWPISYDVYNFFREHKDVYKLRFVKNLHAKIIWFKNFGVYIGSANLKKTSWTDNFEAGCFIREDSNTLNIINKIEDYFNDVDKASFDFHKKSITDEFSTNNKYTIFEAIRDVKKVIENIEGELSYKLALIDLLTPDEMIDFDFKAYLNEDMDKARAIAAEAMQIDLGLRMRIFIDDTINKLISDFNDLYNINSDSTLLSDINKQRDFLFHNTNIYNFEFLRFTTANYIYKAIIKHNYEGKTIESDYNFQKEWKRYLRAPYDLYKEIYNLQIDVAKAQLKSIN